MNEVEAHVAAYFWFVLLLTINGRPLPGGTNLIWTVVEIASATGGHVQMALIKKFSS